MKINTFRFDKAIPVWENGTELRMNRNIVLTAKLPAGDYTLRIAASSSFSILVNSEFLAFGPARAGHGYYRVDEYKLAKYLTQSENLIAVRVAGYNINCFEYLDQPSFVCAEIVSGDKAVAYTSAPCVGFGVILADERIEKVQKYSFQRPFAESYRVKPSAFDYQNKPLIGVSAVGEKNFICRDVPYGEYARLAPIGVLGGGAVTFTDRPARYLPREISNICDIQKGYTLDQLEFMSSAEVEKMDFAPLSHSESDDINNIAVSSDSYIDLDMGVNHTGIFDFDLEVSGDGEFYVLYDEVKVNGQLKCLRLGTSSITAFVCKAGKYRFTGMEPGVMRYVRFVAKGCDVTVKNFRLIEVAFPMSEIKTKFVSDDKVMEKIYKAAIETFRANTVDVYMDCPSRERAGWLCDSFFTSRVEYALTGKSQVEKAFLQNFLLPEKFKCLPDGMLPMCYPSDHYDRVFIPNWAMWYGVELGEYFTRSGDRELIDAAKERMYGLYRYFEKFENSDGLLEKLESWVFIEWSKSNELVQDVSYASNMLYSKMLDTFGKLYSDTALTDKAAKIRKTILEQSMTESGFFCDNAVRRDGRLVLSGERTESCQYYAFFCDIVTPESHPWLWNTMLHDFGYDRQNTGKYPEIYPANAFIGNYLRLDLLCRYGCRDELYDNIRGYFEYMADKTGTLWENIGDYASCNHGFASHVIYWMKELGIVK